MIIPLILTLTLDQRFMPPRRGPKNAGEGGLVQSLLKKPEWHLRQYRVCPLAGCRGLSKRHAPQAQLCKEKAEAHQAVIAPGLCLLR